MSGRWFRFYEGALDDPKVQKLPPALFKAWVNLLCLAARNDGRIVWRDVPFALRISQGQADRLLQDLTEAELLELDGDLWRPHNWDVRQFKSDADDPTATERMRRYRNKHRNGDPSKRNADRNSTVTVTVPRTDTDTDTETEQINDDDGKRATAFEIAAALAKICGHPDPRGWPPGWCGAPLWVEKCLNEGWLPAVMLAEARAVVVRKRDGPTVDGYLYLEKPLARAMARHAAPLPKVVISNEPEVIHARQNAGAASRKDRWDAAIARLSSIAADEPEGSGARPPPPRLLPARGSE